MLQVFRSILYKRWSSVVFGDESWICAESWAIRFVSRYDGKELIDEFTIKKNKWKKGKKYWAISAEGPESLYFIEGTESSEAYLKILEECLPDID